MGGLIASLLLYPALHVVWIRIGIEPLALGDFDAYYLATLRVTHGYPLYDPGPFIHLTSGIGSVSYLYPPITVVVFIPFTWLPFYPAALLWNGIQLVVLVAAMWYLAEALIDDLPARYLVVLALCTATYYPTIRWLEYAQITGYLTAAVAVAIASVLNPSPSCSVSSLTLTMAAFIKPYYAVAGTHLLQDRRRIIVALLTGGGLIGLSVLIFGIDTHQAYLSILAEGKGWGVEEDYSRYRFTPFHALGSAALFVKAVLLLLTVGGALYARRSDTSSRYVAALGSVAVPLITPTANTLTLSIALPGLFVLVVHQLQIRESVLVPAAGIFFAHSNKSAIRIFLMIKDRVDSLGIALLSDLANLLFVVHVATVGLLLVFIWVLGRIVTPRDGAGDQIEGSY